MNHSLNSAEKWQKWRSLSWPERRLFVAALCLLPLVGLLLHAVRFQTLYRALRRLTPVREESVSQEAAQAAERAALLVNAAARYGPYDATCLRRSLLLWWLLRRRGIETDLRLGVSKQEGALTAHAWVEHCGHVINDRPDIAAAFVPVL